MMKLPIYLNCYFFDKKNEKVVNIYKIDTSHVDQHPYQLYKWITPDSGHWENLSVYASVSDAVRVLLKELSSKELSDEIYHGQATVNPAEILEKIDQGERAISIYDSTNNETFRLEVGVAFEDLVQRNMHG
jgi:hypothetical protein